MISAAMTSSIRQNRIAKGYPSRRMEPSVEPTESQRRRRAVTLGALLGLILAWLGRRRAGPTAR